MIPIWSATTVIGSGNKPIDTVNVASVDPKRARALLEQTGEQGRSSSKKGDGKHVGIARSHRAPEATVLPMSGAWLLTIEWEYKQDLQPRSPLVALPSA